MKKTTSLLLFAGILLIESGSAAISVFAQYNLGEADPSGHIANERPIVDGSGNGRDIDSVVGEGTARVSTSLSSPGSSSAYDFQGRGFYVGGVFASWDIYQSNNAGIEMWVKASNLGQNSTTIFNASGLSLVWQSGDVAGFGAKMGNTMVGNIYSPTGADEWVHLALVRDSGTTTGSDTTDSGVSTFYVNGVAFGNTVTSGSQAENSVLLGVSPGAGDYFYGGIDEARIFTYSPGAFTPSDLLIPEPSAALMGFAGLLGLALRRRRN